MSIYTIATGLINEINLSRLLQKQRSITRLSPQFYNRVAAVSGKGGIRFTGQKGDTWFFDVHSGTKDGVWWHAKIKFLNLVPVIQDKVRNRKLWNKDRSGVDYRKLAQAVLYAVDIQLEDDCPADLYWAHQYTRSRAQYNAKTPPKETRPPTRNNKKEYGVMCKHLQALVNLLPMYEGTFAKFLKMKYADVVQAAEGSAQKELAAFQGAAAGLRAREEANVED
jgi:hypothetical protein